MAHHRRQTWHSTLDVELRHAGTKTRWSTHTLEQWNREAAESREDPVCESVGCSAAVGKMADCRKPHGAPPSLSLSPPANGNQMAVTWGTGCARTDGWHVRRTAREVTGEEKS